MAPQLLVFGRQGQVARALADAPGGFAPVFAGRETLDLADPDADIAGLIEQMMPDAVINAAAYTHVDRAEAEPAAAMRLNRDAPLAMAQACAARDIPFIHFSTDYVFDGAKGAPYVEGDPVSPLNVYGRTKAEGEAVIAPLWRAGARIALARSSWVFSPVGPGFLQTILRLARERDELGVVDDQYGCPTPAAGCAAAALALTRRLLDRDDDARGLFHAAGADEMSWADFAEAIYAEARARGAPAARVRRITTPEYPTPAPRPADTRLSSARLQSLGDWRAPSLPEALAACFAKMELS